MTGRWIPKITDTALVNKSFKGLLHLAKKKLDKNPLRFFKDSHGVFAFETNDFVVVAKEYPYGWVVSAHEQIVRYALEKKKALVMYVHKAKRFYKFSPREIIDEATKNIRGESRFLNFDIRLGVNIDKPLRKDTMQKNLLDWRR